MCSECQTGSVLALAFTVLGLVQKRRVMQANKITKYDLVESVYQNTKYEKHVIQDVVENLFEQIKQSLKDGNTIELRGFGTFEPRLRKGRSLARNPKTGEKLSVESHYVAAFRAGQQLKNNLWKLNKKDEE